jgi:hypothetical protein
MQRLALSLAALALLLASVFPSPPPAQAQGTVEDVVFQLVGTQLGFIAPTKGQVDTGTVDLPFSFSYRKVGLDLNATGGTPVCSGQARILSDSEFVQGWVGYQIIVTVAGRNYTFRTNGTGTSVIRCRGSQTANSAFGAAPSVGRALPGDDVVGIAMNHLNGYLNLDTPVSVAAIQAEDNGEDVLPYSASYRWDGVLYSNSAFNCPVPGQSFNTGDAMGIRITITLAGRSYQYRVSPNGQVVILCLGGRGDPSSLGVNISQ